MWRHMFLYSAELSKVQLSSGCSHALEGGKKWAERAVQSVHTSIAELLMSHRWMSLGHLFYCTEFSNARSSCMCPSVCLSVAAVGLASNGCQTQPFGLLREVEQVPRLSLISIMIMVVVAIRRGLFPKFHFDWHNFSWQIVAAALEMNCTNQSLRCDAKKLAKIHYSTMRSAAACIFMQKF